MKVSVIGVRTEKTGHDLDDKEGMIIQKIVPRSERNQHEPKFRELYRSNLRVRNFEVEGMKKFFLMKKEHDAYLYHVLSWGFDREILENSLKGLEVDYPGEYVVVDEDDFFGRLTEEV